MRNIYAKKAWALLHVFAKCPTDKIKREFDEHAKASECIYPCDSLAAVMRVIEVSPVKRCLLVRGVFYIHI